MQLKKTKIEGQPEVWEINGHVIPSRPVFKVALIVAATEFWVLAQEAVRDHLGLPFITMDFVDSLHKFFVKGEAPEKIAPGDHMTYVGRYAPGLVNHAVQGIECGIVKSIDEKDPNYIFVVFKFNGDPDNYEKYTAQRCHRDHLIIGWA